MAAVWQQPDIQLFRTTVLDEVRSGLDYRLVPEEEATSRSREALALVGLDGIPEDRDPMSLSGGEQQRLALAAALVLDTPVLVLDEATSALDLEAAERFGEALDQARAARPVTVIAIDHRPDVHFERADRLLVLEDGEVVLDGDPSCVYTDDLTEVQRLGMRLPTKLGGNASFAGALLGTSANEGTPVALRADSICYSVEKARLLDEVCLELPLGSVALITGDNGAGKSTLMRLLATEMKPSRGRVLPRPRTRIREGVGYVPQRGADIMLHTRTVDEVCSALTHGRSNTDDTVTWRALDLLDQAGLGGMEEMHPLRLSGGQRQRLAVLLALAEGIGGARKLALLDEPTSAQDVSGAALVLGLLTDGAESRVTLVATHDPAAFSSVATHQVAMRAGRTVEISNV